VYNAIYSVPHGQGKRLVVSGTSYLQLVSFTDKGPEARGLLAFSSRARRLRRMPVTRHLRPSNWR
jgi:acyl-homoserine-lactone acylase